MLPALKKINPGNIRKDMKTIKEKNLVVGADFAGFPLKEAVVAHLEKKGWKILDMGVKKTATRTTPILCSTEWDSE